MENPFEAIARRLSNIEDLLLDLKHKPTHNTPVDDFYGDFHWLSDTCSGVPESTLRIKSAKGQIPGVVKFGKRVLYEKAAVLKWLRSQTRKATPDSTELSRAANEQVSRQLAKGRGVSA